MTLPIDADLDGEYVIESPDYPSEFDIGETVVSIGKTEDGEYEISISFVIGSSVQSWVGDDVKIDGNEFSFQVDYEGFDAPIMVYSGTVEDGEMSGIVNELGSQSTDAKDRKFIGRLKEQAKDPEHDAPSEKSGDDLTDS
ncbi:MAG: hypothetical protein F4X44_13215 [Gammaproteobacteria bacterium]|nr:hypothetical protein [Gammaproteobacteria bacterium]MYD81556.1 hypothetical protein [Gammaproteobacteria bacterium]